MGTKSESAILRAKIELLAMIIERECNCDKAKCAEHFNYLARLKFEYENQLEDYENGISTSNK